MHVYQIHTPMSLYTYLMCHRAYMAATFEVCGTKAVDKTWTLTDTQLIADDSIGTFAKAVKRNVFGINLYITTFK